MTEEAPPQLGNSKTDYAVMVGRAVSGLVPFAGSFITELIENIVPNQRFDRLVEYVKLLDKRVDGLSEDQIEGISKSPDAIDLFEEGGAQATRALSGERLEYIALLVSFGLTGDERARIEAKRLLSLLKSIDDDQIIILASLLQKNYEDEAFHEKHAHILGVHFVHMQSSQGEMDEATVNELAKAGLVSLGLIRPLFRRPARGEMPEFDSNTGMIKSSGFDITPLGRLMLRRLHLATEGDY